MSLTSLSSEELAREDDAVDDPAASSGVPAGEQPRRWVYPRKDDVETDTHPVSAGYGAAVRYHRRGGDAGRV